MNHRGMLLTASVCALLIGVFAVGISQADQPAAGSGSYTTGGGTITPTLTLTLTSTPTLTITPTVTLTITPTATLALPTSTATTPPTVEPTMTTTPTTLPTATATQIVISALKSYLPLVMKPPPPPTPTNTPIPTSTPVPTNTPIPTATATTIPPTATLTSVNPDCGGVANAGAPNSPVAITNVNKAGNPETVTIKNVTGQAVDVTGWWICSMNGNQLHAVLSGILAPNQTLVVVSQASGPIWNNTSVDPAALYRRDGVQVGYRSQ